MLIICDHVEDYVWNRKHLLVLRYTEADHREAKGSAKGANHGTGKLR